MLTFCLILAFLSGFSFVLGFMLPLGLIDTRPKLQLQTLAFDVGGAPGPVAKKKKDPLLKMILRNMSVINKPLGSTMLRKRIARDLGMARSELTVDEFLFIKEALIVGLLILFYPTAKGNADFIPFWFLMSFAIGYLLPEFYVKGRVKKVKEAIVKNLPDTVDLLSLCVNAGLDFMMALKYLIEKSAPNIIIQEFNTMLQEISVGKPRREALRDLARKYELPDLSTFTRTLVQADRMGTSVSEALNILSEDMRQARFRRGEAMALKAPMKMLVPLLFCIFPVVAILVAGPIFLDFFRNNPMKALTGQM